MKGLLAAAVAALLLFLHCPARAVTAGPEDLDATVTAATAPVSDAPAVSASAAILVDAASGRVLYEKNADEKKLIASTTKLMTALVAAEAVDDLSCMVRIKAEWTGIEGSSLYLKAGEELSMRALLHGLLMDSGNDAAEAVAGYCAGEVALFVEWMNLRAQSLGMEGTRFANPSGLNDENHYSTAADMARLAAACMENETVAAIVGTKSITIEGRSFTNSNKLLSQYAGCVGMKTGYTKLAGRTLVSCAERDGQRLLVVTLDDPNDWADHAALFDYGFETCPSRALCAADEIFARVSVSGSLVRKVAVRPATDEAYPLREEEEIQTTVRLPETAEAPVTAGAIAGELIFTLDGEQVARTYLLYARSVERDVVRANPLVRRILDFFRREQGATIDAWFPVRGRV